MGRTDPDCQHHRPMTQPPSDKRPESAQLLEAILRSPSYAEADRDLGFLDGSDTRGVRLQLDYLKAELMLASFDIEHTIVVFGSAQIQDPECRRSDFRWERTNPRWYLRDVRSH